ncbi:chitin binding domain-containing protein [Scytonema hofmannii FACHB-248]|uniref:Chitin binding domain-containing protein n=1 Tax=Scytonema hofmannii FACHB-248 TaxID=1842502 RepID=A0ABR8GJQ2_9CYAN|nr:MULTISPECIES: chitin binding peritrophin-A domain-containing protein [Nostocales]MBD2603615.1 chitin binding domain-containing protein [Scytonema hofmannii FACHB-248]
MKKILLCCCGIILAMWIAISPALAADIKACTTEGFFPNPEDCSRFYRCVDFDGEFTKFDFDCGPGTVFDPELTTCNHPWAVNPSSQCYKPME